MIKESTRAAVDQLIGRYPALEACREDLIKAVELICASYRQGHKLMVCGNGGSAADAEHIVGELMTSSDVIIAINKDPEAPIFKVADYGVVGDVLEVLPLLTEEFRKLRQERN